MARLVLFVFGFLSLSRLRVRRRPVDIDQVRTVALIRLEREQRGFTLVEVMAAMLVLLVGVLGTVAMIDGANATTSFTKAREGATNLAREALENSRAVDYDKLTSADLAGELQSKRKLPDERAAAGWQIERREIEYTVSVSACIVDDETDGAGSHTGGEFCAPPPGTSTESNPDDYRRVTAVVSWSSRGKPGEVSQTAVVSNPSGGLGPRILSFNGPDTVGPGATTASFTAQTTSAEALRWTVDDGSSPPPATGGPTSWTFSWHLNQPETFSCEKTANWVLDGDYVVTAQAFDGRGIPGDLRARTVRVDRQAPAAPCGVDGGRNGSIVDLQWLRNPERDIAGYRVFRKALPGETGDREVCTLTTETACYDSDPPDAQAYSEVEYYVRAEDAAPPSTDSAPTLTVQQGGNARPGPPTELEISVVDSFPTLSWKPASDADGSIRFYRVYRDGSSLGDRYGATSGPELSFVDRTGATGRRYWVTAVDDKFRESEHVGPVAP